MLSKRNASELGLALDRNKILLLLPFPRLHGKSVEREKQHEDGVAPGSTVCRTAADADSAVVFCDDF